MYVEFTFLYLPNLANRQVQMRERHFNSVTQFINHVENERKKFQSDVLWFRGHYKNRFRLIPGVFREYEEGMEEHITNMFYCLSRPYLKSSPTDGWEWITLMQHYRLKTRLLDWSESSLVALFFSIYQWDPSSAKDGPCVWILEPTNLNKYSIESDNIMIGEGPNLKMWLPKTLRFFSDNESHKPEKVIPEKKEGISPVAIYAKQIDHRITNQKGTFTIHSDDQALENNKSAKSFLVKIKLKVPTTIKDRIDLKKNILVSLRTLGITIATIYPDLDHLSESIIWDYKTSHSVIVP